MPDTERPPNWPDPRDLAAIVAPIEARFADILRETSPYEVMGIFHSEMLLFLAFVEACGIEHVIESGRARGQSSEVIARALAGRSVAFDSVEWERGTADAAVAAQRLGGLGITLHFGDAFKLVPKLMTMRRTALLIDGPKGIAALRLALLAMRNPQVVFVTLHDASRDEQPLRQLIEQYMPLHYISDDPAYCQRMESLDEPCWRVYRDRTQGARGPYRKGQTTTKSYGPTLAVIPNVLSDGDISAALAAIDRLQPLPMRMAIGSIEQLRRRVPDRFRGTGVLARLWKR